jgi:perosamine synthetase
MNIFNSLGSNYNFQIAINTLFASNKNKWKKKLIKFLEDKYKGEVHLFYKGREAIEIALKLANLPRGSFVAINGFTCHVVYKAIVNAGLKVEYLDIGKNNLNFSAVTLEKAFNKNKKIKAVIVQNTLGDPSDIEEINKMCKKNKAFLIEDLAHSVGGNKGDFVTLSFSQDKIIDSVSGGALIIKNKKFQNKFNDNLATISILQQVKDRFYPFFTCSIRLLYPIILGKILHFLLKISNLLSNPLGKINTRIRILPNWYCKAALDCFKNLNKDVKHRKDIVKIYNSNLSEKIKLNGQFIIRYPIIVNNRSSLIKTLKKEGVYISDIWYDAPVAPFKNLTKTNYQKGLCPNSEKISNLIINLPTHKNTTKDKVHKICAIITKWQKQNIQ